MPDDEFDAPQPNMVCYLVPGEQKLPDELRSAILSILSVGRDIHGRPSMGLPPVETVVAARVYGGCVEPGGMDLTDEIWVAPCPKCQKDARHFRLERAEGSLNVYTGYACEHCVKSHCDPWWPEGMDDCDEWKPDDDWEEVDA